MKNIFDLPCFIDWNEAERLDDVFADFEADSEITAEAEERILSSVMERVEADMSNEVSKHKRKIGVKRLFVICIAAAVVLTAAISVAALEMRKNREENLRDILGEGAEAFLEERDISNAQNNENPHFKVYIDTLISDGNYCKILLAYEALDEAAEKQIEYGGLLPEISMYYADTGEKISALGSSQGGNISFTETNCMYSTLEIPLFDKDTSRPVILKFDSSFWSVKVENKDAENLADGVELKVDLSKNVESKILVDDMGRELLLSPIGLSSCAPMKVWSDFNVMTDHEAALIYEDGHEYVFTYDGEDYGFSKEDRNNEEDSLYGYSVVRIYRDKLFDIENCVGVRIDDMIFREKDAVFSKSDY